LRNARQMENRKGVARSKEELEFEKKWKAYSRSCVPVDMNGELVSIAASSILGDNVS
jgi:hypothetical protein